MTKELTRNKRSQYIYMIGLIFLVLVQIANIVHCQNKKAGFHTDEYCTTWYVNTANSYTPWGAPDIKKLGLTWDTWTDISETKSLFTIESNESVLRDSLMKNIHDILFVGSNSGLYFTLLNLLCYVTNNQIELYWCGFILNIIFFVILEIVLYRCLTSVTRNKAISLIVVGIYGFSNIALSHCIYTRFYMMVNMFLMLIVYMHYKIWTRNSWLENLLVEMVSLVILYLSILESELMVVMGGAFIVLFAIAMFVRKDRKRAIVYSVPLIIGAIYYFGFRSNWIDILLHPSEYMAVGYGSAVSKYLTNLYNITPKDFVYNFFLLGFYYSGRISAIIGVIGFTGILIYLFFRKLNKLKEDNRRISVNDDDVYMFVVLGSFSVYTLFITLTSLAREVRYDTIHFLLFVLLFGYFFGRLVKGYQKERVVIALSMFLVLFSAFCIAKRGDIDYIYPEREEFSNILREDYKDWDVMLVHDYDLHGIQGVYDCIYYSGEDVNIYLKSTMDSPIAIEELPNRFLLWTITNDGLAGCEDIENSNYRITPLSKFVVSTIYICEKQ